MNGVGQDHFAGTPVDQPDMQVLLEFRHPTADRRQGNAELAAGGRETPGIDRSQQDSHRLQSIHCVPSTNERVLPETTIYSAVLGGLNRLPTRSAVRIRMEQRR